MTLTWIARIRLDGPLVILPLRLVLSRCNQVSSHVTHTTIASSCCSGALLEALARAILSPIVNLVAFQASTSVCLSWLQLMGGFGDHGLDHFLPQ